MLFIIFVPYAMLPLPLKWCMIAGTISASFHLIIISVIKYQKNAVSFMCNVESTYINIKSVKPWDRLGGETAGRANFTFELNVSLNVSANQSSIKRWSKRLWAGRSSQERIRVFTTFVLLH